MSGRNGTATRFLTREAILGASDIQTEVVEVPEWGGPVLVRGLSVREMGLMSMRQQATDLSDLARVEIGIQMLLACVLDEQRQRLLSDADIEALLDRGGAPVERVAQAVRRLSGMTPEEVAATAKNSVTAQSGASSSA